MEGRCHKDEPREPALPLAVVPLGQARTTSSIVPANSSPADPREKKAMGPFGPGLHRKNAALSLSAGSQTHGINSSEAGSPLGGLGNLPRGHMAEDTLFFVTAAWLGGLRTSADKDVSGAP